MTKKIEAIIKEERLGDVKKALKDIGIVGMNITAVEGHGRQGGVTLMGRSGTYQVDMLPMVQLNIVLSEHNVEKTVQTIIDALRKSGDTGDGLIFIYPVDEVIRARTGEKGAEALSYQDDIDSRLAEHFVAPYSKKDRKKTAGVSSDTKAGGESKPGWSLYQYAAKLFRK